jgi:perosamine synthetase
MVDKAKNENPIKYLGRELEYLEKVLNSENWSSTAGSWVQSLESQFKDRFHAKHAVAFNSGTSTLHAALEAAGIGAGDEVISPAITVMMNATSTIHANAIPVFADVDPDTWCIDPADVERKITDKTKAIMVVSLYGCPADMDPIMQLAEKYNLLVIEDNAQSVLSKYKGRELGTIGHIASYSFENTKHLSCGEGGMIITNNTDLAVRARKVGGHGFKNLMADEGRVRLRQETFQNPNYKRHDSIGWNYRMSEFSAAIALAQLERVDELVQLRMDVARMFTDAMKGCDYLIPQHTPSDCVNTYYTFGAVYNGLESIGITWEDFRAEYIKQGGDGIYGAWSVPYLEPAIQERHFVRRYPEIYESVSYPVGLCPVAERIQPMIMQFKTNYRDVAIASQKVESLVRTINKFKG